MYKSEYICLKFFSGYFSFGRGSADIAKSRTALPIPVSHFLYFLHYFGTVPRYYFIL